MATKFERLFSEEARRALAQAHDEARRLKHNYLGTEHLLLGLIREQTTAALILAQMGVDLGAATTPDREAPPSRRAPSA